MRASTTGPLLALLSTACGGSVATSGTTDTRSRGSSSSATIVSGASGTGPESSVETGNGCSRCDAGVGSSSSIVSEDGGSCAPPPPPLRPETVAGVYCPRSAIHGGGDITCAAGQQCCEAPLSASEVSVCTASGEACPLSGSIVWQCAGLLDCTGVDAGVCCGSATGMGDSGLEPHARLLRWHPCGHDVSSDSTFMPVHTYANAQAADTRHTVSACSGPNCRRSTLELRSRNPAPRHLAR